MKTLERTATAPFRINESVFKALGEEAKNRDISLNAYEPTHSFAHFNRFLRKLGMQKISKRDGKYRFVIDVALLNL